MLSMDRSSDKTLQPSFHGMSKTQRGLCAVLLGPHPGVEPPAPVSPANKGISAQIRAGQNVREAFEKAARRALQSFPTPSCPRATANPGE